MPEREDQSSFFDDIDERQVLNEVVINQGGLLSPASGIGSHLAVFEDDSGIDRELSVYALDGVQSLNDVHQHEFKNQPNQPGSRVETLRVMHCSQLTELRGLHLFP